MSKDKNTPCAALFDMMKRYGGISYKDLASMILSGKPMSDGVSPASRVDDRSWLSRFVVHAPVGSIQANYFADFPTSSLRVTARLKAKKRDPFTSQRILDMVTGDEGQSMVDALVACHQDVSIYQNILKRLSCESGFTVAERAEMAMVLLVAAGCTANVRQAAAHVMDFAKSVHGVGMATPLITPKSASVRLEQQKVPAEAMPTLALMRIVDGYLTGNPYWLDPSGKVTEVGSLANDDGSINDVDPDVSGRHLAIWHDDEGEWRVRGLGSKHGTVLISGADHSEVVVEPPQAQRNGVNGESSSAPLHPGDELLLASNTRFVVLEGIPAS